MPSQLLWHWQEHHIHNSSINYVLHLYKIKSLFYIPLLLHLLSLCCIWYIRLNQFYPSSHSCFFLFFSRSFCIDSFFCFFCFISFFFHFFSHFLIISFSFSPPSLSISLPLSPSLSLAISPYFLSIIFLSFLFLYPHRFFFTLSCFDFYSLHYTPRWKSSS